MNKSELIEAMASKSGLTKKDAESALNAFATTVAKFKVGSKLKEAVK